MKQNEKGCFNCKFSARGHCDYESTYCYEHCISNTLGEWRMLQGWRPIEFGNMEIEIEKVIFNPPATIVFWNDKSKTVVTCGKDDVYDPEKGLAMAISKRAFGNYGSYFNEFKKWIPQEGVNNEKNH